MKQSFVVILASLLLSSCGFYKRQYTSGWMISHRQVSAKQELPANGVAAHLSASANDEQISLKPIALISPTDPIQPDPKDSIKKSSAPIVSPSEPDFYTPPKTNNQYNGEATQNNFSEDLTQRKFSQRVNKAIKGMKFMFIGFGYAILGAVLSVVDMDRFTAYIIISTAGFILGLLAFLYMFYSTFKSFEIIINNPDIKFNSQMRSKLIAPTVLSILFSGYIGLIFALVLIVKSAINRRNK